MNDRAGTRTPRGSTATDRAPRWAMVVVVLFAMLYAVQAWRSVGQVNILIDEVTDTHIAAQLRADPLFGCGNDGSQARLPMYTTALTHSVATRILGDQVSLLASARATSIAVGAVGVILLFAVGVRWFNTTTALLASGLLAIAPYYLNLTRTAMTEGDAYCPTAVLLAMVAFGAYQTQRTTARLIFFGFASGLMIASKFYLVGLLPAFAACDLLSGFARDAQPAREQTGSHKINWVVIIWAVCAAVLMGLAATLTQIQPISAARLDRSPLAPAALLWFVAMLVLVPGSTMLIYRSIKADHSGHPHDTWTPFPAWFAIIPLAAAATFIFPEHALHQNLMRTLLSRIFGLDEGSGGRDLGEAGRLYGSLVLLKLGLPLGVLTLAAGPWLLWRAVGHRGARLVVALLAMYALVLLSLPVRQHFYLMSLYPMIILMLAAFIVTVFAAIRPVTGYYVWGSIAACSVAWLVWGHVQVFPTFGYYGYEITGDHWLGSEPRGYRDVVQVTSDGTYDALDWLSQNARPDQNVYSYLSIRDRWTINRYESERGIPFKLLHHDEQSPADPQDTPDAVPHADFLLIALQNRVTYHDAPSDQAIAGGYDPQPAHTVWRGRGRYRMPVAQIYRAR